MRTTIHNITAGNVSPKCHGQIITMEPLTLTHAKELARLTYNAKKKEGGDHMD